MVYAPPLDNVTRQLLRGALRFLLPAACLACGEEVREPRHSLGLCDACRDRLEPWPAHGCNCCGRPLAGVSLPDRYVCGACRRHPPPYGQLLSAWSYQPPLDAVLAGLKFRRLEYLGDQLGSAAIDLLGARLAECELVVPVPLHWWRHLGRSYNQAAVIARPVASALGVPLVGALRRHRPTPAQSRLSRVERQRNLRDAFVARRRARLQGKHVLLVDDIVTTGATLRDAATCLRRAGARSVTAFTVARTPEPE